jgi:very-short-patch-repair endonuclease
MPKKSSLSSTGKSFLSSGFGVRKRGLKSVYKPPPDLVRLPTGQYLNIPESKVYRALEDLKINFSAQESFGGGRTLGGSLADFVLPDYQLVIEYQGPFHSTSEGSARDFWRRVAREQAGFMVAYLYEEDLINIHRRLKEILGAPATASGMSRR